MSNYTMSLKQWALLVLLSVMWGANFFFIEISLRELGALTIVFLRIIIAVFILSLYLFYSGQRLPRELSLWTTFIVLALLNCLLPFFFIAWGQIHIDSGLSAILNATTPVFSVLMTHFLTHDELMTRNKIIGVFVGLSGVCILVGPSAVTGISLQALGQFAMIGAAICYAYGTIRTRRLQKIPVIVVVTGTFIVASVMLLPMVLLFEPPEFIHYQPSTIVAILYLGLMGTAAGHFIFYYIVARAGANNTSLVAFMVPITAVLLGVFVLGEKLSSQALFGMFVIFAGLALIDGKLIRRVLN